MIKLNKSEEKYYLTIEAVTKIAKPNFTAIPFENTSGQFEELLCEIGQSYFVLSIISKSDEIPAKISQENDPILTDDQSEVISYSEKYYNEKDTVILVLKDKITGDPVENYERIRRDALLIIRDMASGQGGHSEVFFNQMDEAEFKTVIENLNTKYDKKVQELRDQGLDRLTFSDRISLLGMNLFICFLFIISPIILAIVGILALKNKIWKK